MNLLKNSNSLATRVFVLAYSTCCYALFLFTLLYLIGFLGSVWVPKNINDGPLVSWPYAALINFSLIIFFGVQHSVMARKRFKTWIVSFVPAPAERSTYVLFSSLALLLMFWLWHPLTATVWKIDAGWAKATLTSLFWLGWGIALLATLLISHIELFGLKQAVDHWHKTAAPAPTFSTPLLYKFVRHPLYLGFLISLWATPYMTAGHLLLAVGLSIYILIGACFEETDLVVLFGAQYRRYQQEVGMLFPWPKRRKKYPE